MRDFDIGAVDGDVGVRGSMNFSKGDAGVVLPGVEGASDRGVHVLAGEGTPRQECVLAKVGQHTVAKRRVDVVGQRRIGGVHGGLCELDDRGVRRPCETPPNHEGVHSYPFF